MSLEPGAHVLRHVVVESNPEQERSKQKQLLVAQPVLVMRPRLKLAMKMLAQVILHRNYSIQNLTNKFLLDPKLIKLTINFYFSVPIDCAWGAYGNWTQCSKSCGGGTQIRTREIATQARNGGARCDGTNTDLQLCNEFPCPSKYKINKDYIDWNRNNNNYKISIIQRCFINDYNFFQSTVCGMTTAHGPNATRIVAEEPSTEPVLYTNKHNLEENHVRVVPKKK